jgi:hypothetical protein
LCFIQQFDRFVRFGRVNGSAIYIFFYSNLFGIVQQTTKRNMISVPIFQFVPANAVPIFQLGAANAVPNFKIANLSLQMQCQLAVRNIKYKISPFLSSFLFGLQNIVLY